MRSLPLALLFLLSSAGAQQAPAARVEQTVNQAPPRRVKVNPKDGLTYVWIPAGAFTMGCSPKDRHCAADEKPAHQVTITKEFWIGQTEVTQEAYQRVTGGNPSRFKGPKLPVETIGWYEAQSYCQAVGMRLPTEAEWEYAARAGAATARYADPNAIAWHSGNSGNTTHEAGKKQANAWGLYDMLGNVFEWVADWYGPYPTGSQSDPRSPPGGQVRVLRGGSWNEGPKLARASSRVAFEPGLCHADFGLRCAGN